jgi:thymidylate kinase
LSKILAEFGYYRITFLQGKNHKLFDVKLLPRLKGFWGLVEFISVLPWILIKVKLRLLFGNIVIAERYVLDTIVTVAYFLGDSNFLQGHLSRILTRMISRDALLIYLNAETKIVLDRLESRGNEETNPEFIRFQQKAYLSLATSLGALCIDTSENDVIGTFQSILRALC